MMDVPAAPTLRRIDPRARPWDVLAQACRAEDLPASHSHPTGSRTRTGNGTFPIPGDGVTATGGPELTEPLAAWPTPRLSVKIVQHAVFGPDDVTRGFEADESIPKPRRPALVGGEPACRRVGGPGEAGRASTGRSSSRVGFGRCSWRIASGATGPEKQKGGLRLDSGPALLKGGDAGPVVLPGDPEESPLIEAVRHEGGPRCPPRASCRTRRSPTSSPGSGWGPPGPPASEALARPSRRARPREALGVPARAARLPGGQGPRLARDPIDRFVLAKLEAKGLDAVARGRPADADPPRDVRPDRPAADARGGRGVRGRRVARRLRAAGRPAARLAALRRALGAALARRGPLRRHQGLRLLRGRELPLGVHLPRLRHPRVQRRPALRPVRPASSSPPTGSRSATTGGRWRPSASSRSAGGS